MLDSQNNEELRPTNATLQILRWPVGIHMPWNGWILDIFFSFDDKKERPAVNPTVTLPRPQ